MTQQHTPGPWTLHRLEPDPHGIIMIGGWEISTRVYDVVCGCLGVAPIRNQADARLITAAPDLLAALERLLPALEWSRPGEAADGSIFCWVCVNTQAEGHAADCKIGLARAAIARATSPQAR